MILALPAGRRSVQEPGLTLHRLAAVVESLADMVDAVDIKVKKRKAVSSAEMKDGQDDSKMETSEPAAATLEASNDEEREDEVEVEVLSHAEQRKRRKLEKAKALSRGIDGVDVDESEEAVAAGALGSNKANAAEPPKASRSTFGIWVGNLSFKTDADKVRFILPHYYQQILTLHCFPAG